MLVPILLVVLALMISVAIGVYTAKKRFFDGLEPPDIRPDDRPPPAGLPTRPAPTGLPTEPRVS